MTFELTVVSNTPLTGEKDPRIVARTLLRNVGYLATRGADSEIPFKLFYDCFLLHAEKVWLVEELVAELKTTPPTVYRHLNKLKDYDILEEVALDESKRVKGKKKKGYRIRYGNFAKSWNFVEAHLRVAMENYGKSVQHLQELVEGNRAGD